MPHSDEELEIENFWLIPWMMPNSNENIAFWLVPCTVPASYHEVHSSAPPPAPHHDVWLCTISKYWGQLTREQNLEHQEPPKIFPYFRLFILGCLVRNRNPNSQWPRESASHCFHSGSTLYWRPGFSFFFLIESWVKAVMLVRFQKRAKPELFWYPPDLSELGKCLALWLQQGDSVFLTVWKTLINNQT